MYTDSSLNKFCSGLLSRNGRVIVYMGKYDVTVGIAPSVLNNRGNVYITMIMYISQMILL